ncbi:pyridoxamine 5'-phosphate oxidase [Sulfuriferula plumbiphila]|uniref:Pyridoxamine 5'-phosphate oxidase n=1 Tax=Sulfuriferula plumbiphila TaxID=171865 RepID=A0A512L4S1_9PROT|nr:pyridoxamine 5'-phosphate oxidase family protein [Sulfuriferula plumbiphila]BBP03188.1 pyridoxamine 5'-phosphate oxidase [Sulfuriferula plumbiphila]GEP29475.1 pyridoxamine 5'-phosphate oxidase [Sulfuriferula plumbiphila]
MAKFYPALTEQQQLFIRRQKIFFTATAPAAGRINLSPKGMDSLRVLSPDRVVYLDLTGSGNESAAHLLENGRMTLMFCSFDADPLILRLYGQGRAVKPRDADWASLRAHFPALPAQRQIIELNVDSVQTSCGYAVPQYVYAGERDTLARWAEKKGAAGLLDYWREKNRMSIDGLPSGLLED